jgi:hypothetical protein
MRPGAVHVIPVNLRLKCAAHLRSRAAKRDPEPAAGDIVNLQSLRFEPPAHFVRISLAQSKAVGELFRVQPAVEVGRRCALLLGEERFETGGRGQMEGRVADRHGGVDGTQVVLRPGAGMYMPAQRNGFARAEGPRNAVLSRKTGRQNRKAGNYDEISRRDHGYRFQNRSQYKHSDPWSRCVQGRGR